MSDIEIALTDLGEIATRELAKEHKPYGLEQKLGKSVINSQNNLNYEYVDEKEKLINRPLIYGLFFYVNYQRD